MHILKTFLCLLVFVVLSFKCTSITLTNNAGSFYGSSNTVDPVACGTSIEYLSDKYKTINNSYPIHTSSADEYIRTKIGPLEDFFNKKISSMTNDTVRLYVNYQSAENAMVTFLQSVNDSIQLMNEINREVFNCQALDSLNPYVLWISLVAVKKIDKVTITIRKIGIGTMASRSRQDIMKTVMQNIGKLRYEYNRILRTSPEVMGRLTMEFLIDETGTVIYLQILESSVDHCEMENNEVNIVKKWKFGPIGNGSPNLTSVVYPFVFSR